MTFTASKRGILHVPHLSVPQLRRTFSALRKSARTRWEDGCGASGESTASRRQSWRGEGSSQVLVRSPETAHTSRKSLARHPVEFTRGGYGRIRASRSAYCGTTAIVPSPLDTTMKSRRSIVRILPPCRSAHAITAASANPTARSAYRRVSCWMRTRSAGSQSSW